MRRSQNVVEHEYVTNYILFDHLVILQNKCA